MNERMLRCPLCKSVLSLGISFDGLSSETEAGENTNFFFPLSLNCTNSNCGNVFTLGRLNSPGSFSKSKIKNYAPSDYTETKSNELSEREIYQIVIEHSLNVDRVETLIDSHKDNMRTYREWLESCIKQNNTDSNLCYDLKRKIKKEENELHELYQIQKYLIQRELS